MQLSVTPPSGGRVDASAPRPVGRRRLHAAGSGPARRNGSRRRVGVLAAAVVAAALSSALLIGPPQTSGGPPTGQQMLDTKVAAARESATAGRRRAVPPNAHTESPSRAGHASVRASGPSPAGTRTGSRTPTRTTTGSPIPSGSATRTPGAATVAAAPGAPASTPNPLAGLTFYGPNVGAAAAAGQAQGAEASLLSDLARVPTATWLGAWSGDVTQTVRQVVAAAQVTGGVPVFVAYDIPGRDCGGLSAGGETSAAGYGRWIRGVAAGIGASRAVVVVEPDALAQLCGNVTARYRMLHDAVEVLEANPGTRTYLDGGHSNWVDAATMAERLRSAGVADADGFALNVSNFQTTADNETYGRAVSRALGGTHFVVDTSRNGNGAGTDWCNPQGRAVGQRPTTQTGQALVDAFLWIKTPGESDGTCNGGPAAGTFWPQYALALMRAS